MKFASTKTANEVIRESKEKELTCYFGQTFSDVLPQYISLLDMKGTLMLRGFREAEANLIVAAMVKAGCKFTI